VTPLLALDYAAANTAANSGAVTSGSFGFQAYLRLKLLSVVEGIASSVCRVMDYPATTTHALFVRRALLAWAEAAGLLATSGNPTDEQRQFLRTFDLGYGHRRLAFVIGRVSSYYGKYDREPLNVLKHRLYELSGELGAVLERPDAAFLQPAVERIFGEARLGPYLPAWRVAPFLESARPEIDELRATLGAFIDSALDGFGERVWGELERLTAEMPAEMRDDLRARYLGFPYWDSTTYPARALSDVAELDEVQVVRVSPLDTHRLSPAGDGGAPPTAAAKLHGVALGHFGAFFRRSWRENDYLWGRLDGAERLLWLIGDTTDESAREAFAAIVAEEKPKLRKAAKLVRRVEDYVSGRSAGAAPGGAAPAKAHT
jgi:hypothetical protein